MVKRLGCLLLIMYILMYTPAAAQQSVGSVSAPAETTKMYLPGDLVHLVVGAPANIVEVVAQMPDGSRFQLDFERRTHIWHGLWEVPYGFKKGVYSADLIATDVEGRQLEGKTTPFYIGEPALITLIGVGELTKESGRGKPVAGPPPTTQRSARVEGKPAVAPPPTVQKPVPLERKRAAATAQPRPKPKKIKNLSRAEAARLLAKQKEDNLNLTLKLLTLARIHLTTQQYEKAKADLHQLLKINPNNPEVKVMLVRVEKIGTTKGGNR